MTYIPSAPPDFLIVDIANDIPLFCGWFRRDPTIEKAISIFILITDSLPQGFRGWLPNAPKIPAGELRRQFIRFVRDEGYVDIAKQLEDMTEKDIQTLRLFQ